MPEEDTLPRDPGSLNADQMADIQRRLSMSIETLDVSGPGPVNMQSLKSFGTTGNVIDANTLEVPSGIRMRTKRVSVCNDEDTDDGCTNPDVSGATSPATNSADSSSKLGEMEVAYAGLRLRDGVHRPYPYLLDTRRVFSYTKLRFYRKGALSNYVGEICLFGASLVRPDPHRPIIHLKVPNFTYYLHVRSKDEEETLVLRIQKWISVANLPYTNRHSVFLTVSVVPDRQGKHQTTPRCDEGYIKEGMIKFSTAVERTWVCTARTRYSVIYFDARTDVHQEMRLSFDHTQLGLLGHSQPLRVSEILGHHSGAVNGYLNVPLFERSRKHAGVMRISWDVAPERYLKLKLSGSNVWRKDFVRPDPFFRIKKHSSNGSTTVIYRSEAYKNVAHPEFLPVQLAVPPAYVTKPGRDKRYVMLSCIDEKPEKVGEEHGSGGGGGAPETAKTNEPQIIDWVSSIVTARDDKSDANKKLNLLRVMEGELGRLRSAHTEAEAAEITRHIVNEVERASKGKRSINDNDSSWSTVSLLDTLTFEFWDNNISRSRRLTKPCLIGTLEVTLRSVLGDVDFQLSECGDLNHPNQNFRLVRSARYNDDEPPATEVTRVAKEERRRGRSAPPVSRQGRGGDCSNAQSTVLPTPEARMRALESKVKLHSICLEERASFLHFIRGKWCIELVMCVDFTQGAQQQHKQSRVVPSWNMFQMLITHCMSFLGTYTGRGGADLYGFAGVQPSGEFQVFPIHKHPGLSVTRPEGDASMRQGVQHEASDDEEDVDEGVAASLGANVAGRSVGDHQTTDLAGNSLQMGYLRAKEQMGRLFDSALPVFLLPVIRTSAARVREVSRARTEAIEATTDLFFQELTNFKSKGAKCPFSLLQMASFLDKAPHHTFGVGVVMIGGSMVCFEGFC